MGKMVKRKFLALFFILTIAFALLLHFLWTPKRTSQSQPFLIKNLPFESIIQKAFIKGYSKKNTLWQIKAEKILSKNKLSEIYFTSPNLLITLNDNSTVKIMALSGVYYKNSQKIKLEHQIKGKYRDIILNANFMYFNLRVNKIVFNHGIKLKKDKLTVQGTDCVIDLNDRSITITKNVKVIII